MTRTRQPFDETRVGDRIKAVVGSWPEVELGPHRFGGVEFRLGRRELGHLRGESHADIAFPRRVRERTGRSRAGAVRLDESPRRTPRASSPTRADG